MLSEENSKIYIQKKKKNWQESLGGGESDCTSNFEHKQPIMMQ